MPGIGSRRERRIQVGALTATLFRNARVFTARSSVDFVDSFSIEDGRVTSMGRAASGARQVDLKGRTVLPGFIDAHTHPSLVAATLGAVSCSPPHVNSIEEMVQALRASPARKGVASVWIEGYGYDEANLAEHRTPTCVDLDRVSTGQPVYVARSDCHSAVCNTLALQLAGITRGCDDPPGGTYGRFDDGEPNGVLTELGATVRVLQAKGSSDRVEQVARMARLADHYNRRGIVALTDMAAERAPHDQLTLFREASAHSLRQQLLVYYDWSSVRRAGSPALPPSALDGRVRVGGVKVFADGSISNRTAWVTTPFQGTQDCGMATLPEAELHAALDYARRHGVQLAVHAMGDAGIGHVIDTLAPETPWLDGLPSVRLEHASLITRDHMVRINSARMSFGVVTQIIFLFAEQGSYAANLGETVLRDAYPLRALYDDLRFVALSSDAPATTWSDPDDVMLSITAAVTRRASNGAELGDRHRIGVAEAVLLYTARAAQVAPFSGLGVLQPGAEASFVVLDRDLFCIPAETIGQVRIDETYIAGECVFQRS